MRNPLMLASEMGGNAGAIAGAIVILMGAVFGLGFAVKLARRRWLDADRGAGSEWTLQDLRALRAKGALTDAEYEKLRASLIAGIQAANTKDASAEEKAEDS